MPTTELGPTAIGNYDQWNLIAGANKWTACQRPNDDVTTRIQIRTANQKQSFVMENLPSDAGIIVQVDVYARVGAASPYVNWRSFSRLGGTDLFYTAHAMTGSWTSWIESDVAKPGSGGWDVASVNSTEIGIELLAGSSGWQQCTTLETDVTWQPVEMGYLFNTTGSLLLPLLARVIIQSEMPKLLRIANQHARARGLNLRFTQEDEEPIWRERCKWCFPVYFDLAA